MQACLLDMQQAEQFLLNKNNTKCAYIFCLTYNVVKLKLKE